MGEETRAAVRAIEMVERKDRVLIVEDEDNARKGYEQLLQRWGCDVVGVGTAEEALAKFASYQPDTLIADVELPGMNGLDLLKQLGTELHGVPAIIITGKGGEERAVAAIEERSRERPSGASGASSWPIRERCCWTKSAKCRRRRKRSCCVYWKTAKCGGWGARARLRWTCGLSQRPTKNRSKPSAAASCGRTCTSA